MHRLVAGFVLAAAVVTPAFAARVNRAPTPSFRVGVGPSAFDTYAPVPAERRTNGKPFRGVVPVPPASRQWLRVETPHFIVMSSAGDHRARAVAEDLERLAAVLIRTSPYFRLPPRRTRVFLFGNRHDVQPYFDAVRGFGVDATGVTVRMIDANTMLIDASARGGIDFTPRHELVHSLLRRGDRALPLWIDEGLAEYYSNAGLPIREHISRLRGRLRMPLDTMFATRLDSPQSASYDFYAQSWATVATLLRRNPQLFFNEFLRDADDAPAAVAAHFRLTPRELELEMRKVSAPASSVLINTPSQPLIESPASRADVLLELGNLLAAVRGRDTDAERHFRAAIETDRENGTLSLRLAEHLLRDHGCASEARTLAQFAMTRGANVDRAHAVIGFSYVIEKDIDSGLPFLESAYEQLPDRADIALQLYSIYMSRGDRATADVLFERLLTTPNAIDARRILLDVDVARANELLNAGNIAEAARVVRALATKMPDHARQQLEAQAAALESHP